MSIVHSLGRTMGMKAGGWVLPLAAAALLTWMRAFGRGLHARRHPLWGAPQEPASWPSVSVIVPAWNERNTLDACLALLAGNDYVDFDVIVAAGGPDGTYESAVKLAQEMSGMQVIRQAPRGKNAALNQALPYASGEVIVFLDADSQIGRDWLRRMVAPLCHGFAATTGNYFPLRDTLFSRQGEMAKVLEYEVRGRVIVQGSGGIAVPRSVLDAIGPFPEGAYSSDWDLDARLAAGGFRRAFVPQAVVYSHRPATPREWWKNELRWRRLHLLSLLRLKSILLRDPISTARHLYPYSVAWGLFAATLTFVATAVLDRTSDRTFRRAAGALWSLLTGAALAREAASAIEVVTYDPDERWLPVVAATPPLAVAGWTACALASLSSKRATVHFKGPRETWEPPKRTADGNPAGGNT